MTGADLNWREVKKLFADGSYVPGLFWLHLALEKLAKALWVQDNAGNTPPYTHNIVRILSETSLVLNPAEAVFAQQLNTFQLEGRYEDYIMQLRQGVNQVHAAGDAGSRKSIPMHTQATALARVRQLAEQLLAHSIGLRRVVLFGSYARNEQRRYSDIDVALVADKFSGFGFQDVGLMGEVLIDKRFIDIEPHTFSPEQFTDWNPFVQEIKRTGIVVGEWEPTAPAPQGPRR